MGGKAEKIVPCSVHKFVMELIPQCSDLKGVLSHIYKQYELPVIVTDISYHLIAYGGPIPCPDIYWDAIITRGTASPETIVDSYYKDGYMDRLSEEMEPFNIDWGVSKDSPQTTCAVYVGGNIEAISSVLYVKKENYELSLEINAALRSAAEIFLTMNPGTRTSSTAPDRALVARLLLEDTEASITTLENTSFFKNVHVVPGYVIMAIQLRNQVSGRLQNLRSGLKSRFPSMLYANLDDGVYCFFTGISSTGGLDQILDVLHSEASGKADYVCGISEIFNDLERRCAYVQQAGLALAEGLADNFGEHDYHFSKLYASIICRVGYQNVMHESLILPEIRTLMDADRTNVTNFYESMKCYLYSKCDMSKTAAQLFLHRNSMMYRIKRCQEIMDVDFSDQKEFERLYTCCRVIDRLEKK